MSFQNVMFTNKGRILQAKANAGVKLNFTKLAIGDGQLTGQHPSELNSLINKVRDISLTRLKSSADGTATIGGMLSNSNLQQGFYFRELGLFAEDPQLGEILYCYGNAGALAEYIPAGDGSEILEREICIKAIVGNATNVTAMINQSLIYATQQEIEELRNELVSSVNGKNGTVVLTTDDIKDSNGKTVTSLMGEMATLNTTDKTSLVKAINELFTNASNGKQNWVDVVGSPLLNTDTFATLMSKTQALKNTMATNLTNKGQSSVGTESLSNLINKVANVNTGKKFASGTSTTDSNGKLIVTGLSFWPSLVILQLNDGIYKYRMIYHQASDSTVYSYFSGAGNLPRSINMYGFFADPTGNRTGIGTLTPINQSDPDWQTSSNGFTSPKIIQNCSCKWWAYE